MWIKRDFTLSHCHPNIRTIAKHQNVLSGKWWVFTDSLARKTIPKRGRGYPTRELAWKSRRCFEANAGFSGYPTKQLDWKGLKASFSFRLKRFHRTKLLFLRIWYDIKRFRRTKSVSSSGCLKSTCRNEILCTHIQGRKRILDSH